MHQPINVIPMGGGRAGVGILTFCPKIFVKTTPPGQRILSENTEIPPKYDVYNNNQLLFTPHILIDELMLKIEAHVWKYALILSD